MAERRWRRGQSTCALHTSDSLHHLPLLSCHARLLLPMVQACSVACQRASIAHGKERTPTTYPRTACGATRKGSDAGLVQEGWDRERKGGTELICIHHVHTLCFPCLSRRNFHFGSMVASGQSDSPNDSYFRMAGEVNAVLASAHNHIRIAIKL